MEFETGEHGRRERTGIVLKLLDISPRLCYHESSNPNDSHKQEAVMGRQTRFFATSVDLEELLGAVVEKGGRLLNHYGEEIAFDVALDFIRSYYAGEITHLYPPTASPDVVRRRVSAIAIPDAVLVIGKSLDGTPYIDQMNSEVIEFSMNSRSTASIPKRPTADPLPAIENGYECGRFWYERVGFDRERVESYLKPHEKELTKLFNFIHRYIRKNYRINTTKSEYIGPDAYKAYQNGTFVPCQGQYRYIFEEDSEKSAQ